MSNRLSPSQKLLALRAVTRLRDFRTLLTQAGVPAMHGETIPIPLDEMECLCLAAAAELDLTPEEYDTGEWVMPAVTTFVEGVEVPV